jgi:hypothetical protein
VGREGILLLKSPYHGASRRTHFRKQAEKKRQVESAKHNMKITSFFGMQNPVEDRESRSESEQNSSESNSCLDNIASSQLSLAEAIERLRVATQNNPNVAQQRQMQKAMNGWKVMCLLAIRQYFQHLERDNGKIRISEEIAKFLFPDRNQVHQGRLIRQWADHHLHSGMMPERRQGRFVKVRSLIDDDDVQRILWTQIRSESEDVLTSCTQAFWVKENLHLKINLTSLVNISEKTAQRWLKLLALNMGNTSQGCTWMVTKDLTLSDVVRNFFSDSNSMRGGGSNMKVISWRK